MPDLICMAKIRTAHGVRGLVKLECFGEDPAALPDYNPLTDETGTVEFNIVRLQPHKEYWLTEIEGVADRTAAEDLRNIELFMPRSRLPQIEEEGAYYHLDLEGLSVQNTEGQLIGIVKSVQSNGAQDLLEIKPEAGKIFLIPFVDDFVPKVDIQTGMITIDPPEGLIED